MKVGAHSSPKKKLKVGELRNLINSWPQAEKELKVSLTWLIQILLVQK